MSNILSWIIWLPVIGMLAISLIPRDNSKIIKQIAAITSGIQLLLATYLWQVFDSSMGEMQFMERVEWIPSFNITYILGVDGLSLPMVLLMALIGFIGIFVSWNIDKAVKGYFSLFLLLNTGVMGVFLALDFFLFYIFWEVMLLPMYFLIGMWGGPQREYAAIKFFLYTLAGSVLMLIAILALYFTCGNTFDMLVLMETAPVALNGMLWWGMSAIKVIWVLLFIGFAIKVPVFPFHTWLPLAHVEAPTAISVILAGVLLKMGTYGLLRISYPLLPSEVVSFSYCLAILGVINIIWGAMNAIAQIDMKKMVAYSSVSHMGYVCLGMAAVVSNNPAGSHAGMNGAVMQMFNHGTITAMLFILVGVIYDQAHHRWIMFPSDYEDKDLAGKPGFGGLGSQMPIYTGLVAFTFFAGLGLPGLSGFISEALCFIGGFSAFKFITVIGTLGILLNAIYFLRAYQRVFLGQLNERCKEYTDIKNLELLAVVPLAIVVLLFGIYPAPLIDLISPAVENIIAIIQSVN